jgi:hypothetical protein
MTFLEQADHLVRNHRLNKELMELGFGCEFIWTDERYEETHYTVTHVIGSTDILDGHQSLSVYAKKKDELRPNSICWDTPDDYDDGQTFFDFAKILGKPPQLQHYLRVLAQYETIGKAMVSSDATELVLFSPNITFSLITGAPATEADARVFCEKILGNENKN